MERIDRRQNLKTRGHVTLSPKHYPFAIGPAGDNPISFFSQPPNRLLLPIRQVFAKCTDQEQRTSKDKLK